MALNRSVISCADFTFISKSFLAASSDMSCILAHSNIGKDSCFLSSSAINGMKISSPQKNLALTKYLSIFCRY